ncbi:aspartyl/asparaginyl beta-hydroxylase domain-containing protein [Xylophilus sp.]|uniref:aspartyl/asparaginyl beta-hydroxylase domain-containing protein n=1 Tax=Xylophilus sp. TaxID=2653893 RepID=UPI002D7E4421|nr:aspartyl/asparaginyl beta-hydroxylase domain-containing protein [Xylophilus sp.]
MIKWGIVALFAGSAAYVHFRGRVRTSFWRQLINHSTLLAPVNCLLYAFSRVPARPYLDHSAFPGLRLLDAHWETIRAEALALAAAQRIRAAERNDDAGFNSFFKEGWTRFYLKWYEAHHPSAQALCPQTVALLKRIPEVKAALFAVLPAGGKLNPHRDPYAGSIRYHLGLVTPNDDRCYIEVDGQRYSWRDGESVLFDETFIHRVENTTAQGRIILFCDVERPMRYRWAGAFNRWFARNVMTAASSPNEQSDQTGAINRFFHVSWVMGQYRRRFKAWNPTVYRATKVLLVALVVALLVWA